MRWIATACALVMLSGCGGGTTSSLTPAPTPKPTPTPTPEPPDNESISIGANGVGVYQLISIPVVIIHNNAVRHGASGVVVHLSILRNGRAIQSIDSPSITLAPGASMAIAGDCTDTCTGANGVSATLDVASWVASDHAPLLSSTPGVVSGGTGRGQADVTATVSGQHIAAQSLLDGFSVCYAGNGAIVGGGLSTFSWNGTGSQSVTVPVIVSSAVGHCDVYAALGA